MAMWKSIGNSVAEREGGSGAKVVPLKRALKAQKFLANGRYEMPPLLYGNYSLLRAAVSS